jgi:predicted RNA binding protein YcfA (HicA-like mRNA interferase family)
VPLKVRERIESDGWRLARTTGSNRHYVHNTKLGVVTVPGKPSKDLPIGTERSILKEAGIDERLR